MSILSKVSRGTVQEKMQWIFELYDLNGDGLISKKEMLEVVSSIYEMLGRATQPTVDETSAKDHVEKIFHVSFRKKMSTFYKFTNIFLYNFQLIDTNKDGVVTIDELMHWCSRDEETLKSLDTLDTIL